MSDPRLLDESAGRQFRRRLLLWKVTACVMTAALVERQERDNGGPVT